MLWGVLFSNKSRPGDMKIQHSMIIPVQWLYFMILIAVKIYATSIICLHMQIQAHDLILWRMYLCNIHIYLIGDLWNTSNAFHVTLFNIFLTLLKLFKSKFFHNHLWKNRYSRPHDSEAALVCWKVWNSGEK